MKKKQTKHFVPNKNSYGNGVPACDCFSFSNFEGLHAFSNDGEVAKTRRGVTCGNCRRTRAFKGEVFRGEK